MIRRIREVLGIALLALWANTAFGVAAICNENGLVTNGGEVRDEQLIWNYYDYWYSGIYVAGGAIVEERVPPDTAYTDTDLAARVEAGDEFLVGYPLPWRMDSYLRIDCPPAAEQADPDAPDDAAGETSADQAGAPIALLCSSPSVCEPLPSSTSGAEPTVPDASAPRAASDGASELIVTGLIHTVADGVLIVQTEAGRYVTMTLPADVQIVRHTPANLDDLRTGDVIGATVGSAALGSREALALRVYRGGTRDSIVLARVRSDATAPAGAELRGIVRSTAGPDAATIRIGYATLDSNLRIVPGAQVTIVEPADAANLQRFSVRVRAYANRQDDGSLLVRAIDVLSGTASAGE